MTSIKKIYNFIQDENNSDDIWKLKEIFREISMSKDYERCLRSIKNLNEELGRNISDVTTSTSINTLVLRAVRINHALEKVSFDEFTNLKGSPLSDVISDIEKSRNLTLNSLSGYENIGADDLFNYLTSTADIHPDDVLEIFKVKYLHDKGNFDKINNFL